MGLAIAGIAVLLAAAVAVLLLRGGKKSAGGGSKAASRKSAAAGGSRGAKKSASDQRRIANAPTQPFAAVSVQPGMSACEAATAAAGIRKLRASAPDLPLEGCDKAQCHCKLQSHDDRRSGDGEDRRVGYGLQSELYGTGGETNRRKRRGRRITDV